MSNFHDWRSDALKRFTKGLVQHRVLVIILCLALIVPSILGMAATRTKYDLLYYLPQELETVKKVFSIFGHWHGEKAADNGGESPELIRIE